MSRRLTVMMCCIVAAPALAALPPGSQAPDFTTQASLAGKAFTFTLKDVLKKGPVVVYFYPAAFTRGCNLQAHTFAEQMTDFTSAGATVIGVSLDKIETLNEFSAIHNTAPANWPWPRTLMVGSRRASISRFRMRRPV